MLRGSWLHDLAAIGAIAAFIAFLAWAMVDSNHTSKQDQAYSADRCAEQKSQHSAGLSVRKIEQSLAANEGSSQSRNQQEPEPDWCDLAAQESMAQSTIGMKWSAWATTILTMAGVILLGFTLHYTKRAALAADETLRQAEATTRAAIAAVEVSENTLIAHERPWLEVSAIILGVRFDVDGDHLTQGTIVVRFTMKNFGNSPAIRAQIYADAQSKPYNAFDDNRRRFADRVRARALAPEMGRVVFPGTEFSEVHDIPIWPKDIAANQDLRGQTIKIGYIYPDIIGCAAYNNSRTGVTHETGFVFHARVGDGAGIAVTIGHTDGTVVAMPGIAGRYVT